MIIINVYVFGWQSNLKLKTPQDKKISELQKVYYMVTGRNLDPAKLT